MSTAAQLLLGAAGGLLPDVLRVVRGRYASRVPTYLTRWWFWLGVVLAALVGALTAWLVGADSAVTALACGYAAPSILTTLLGQHAPAGAGAAADADAEAKPSRPPRPTSTRRRRRPARPAGTRVEPAEPPPATRDAPPPAEPVPAAAAPPGGGGAAATLRRWWGS